MSEWGLDVPPLAVASLDARVTEHTMARYRNPAAGLLAPYLSIVNSLIHLGAAMRNRRYNPGAWIAGLLLLPGGLYSAAAITRATAASARDHERAFVGGVLLHLIAIVIILSSRPEPQDGRSG